MFELKLALSLKSMKVCELQIQIGHANRIINFDKCYTYDTLYI